MPAQPAALAALAFMAAHSAELILEAHSAALISAQPAWAAWTDAVVISGHQSHGGQSLPPATIPPNAATLRIGAAPGATTADLIMAL